MNEEKNTQQNFNNIIVCKKCSKRKKKYEKMKIKQSTKIKPFFYFYLFVSECFSNLKDLNLSRRVFIQIL